MYNFITIHVKCPVCSASLMDNSKKVDNEPGINLIIKSGEKKGHVWLSSVYGSYNHISEIKLKTGDLAEFYCPNCRTLLSGKTSCSICNAPMVDFNMDIGGVVRICSRNGCKNHLTEFEDLNLALRRLYQQYGYHESEYPKHLDLRTNEVVAEKKESDTAEIIKTGTFLMAYCPICRKSLIENEMLKLKVTDSDEGYLLLSPYLNVFSSKSTIFLPEDSVIQKLNCFHCNKSLIDPEKLCEKCGSPAAKISITARTKLIDFYICTKKGCKWHGLNEDDLFEIRLEDNDEW